MKITQSLDLVFQEAGSREIVIVCVGTDRSTGDAFGPIIGTKLQSAGALKGLSVYGSLNEPVHAVNLAATLQLIEKRHSNHPFIIAVDACLGKFDHVGHIILEKGPLRPGAGVKKSLPEFGDYTLTGVVNVCGFMEYFVLQNTRLAIVMRMTEVVFEALQASWQRVLLQRTMVSVGTPH
ncbi:MAG: spore protease YyaC [Alicyclobacillus sp.]|nr:spore protease YyaC [Alicyclobacillus sp.]